MKLLNGRVELQVYGALCSLREFTLDGEDVLYDIELYTNEDVNPESSEPYGCGNMQGIPLPADPKVLKKYNLTEDEFNEIAREAANMVSFGCCGWCV